MTLNPSSSSWRWSG